MMKKKIIGLFTAFVFILFCFSGCGSGKGKEITVGISWRADEDSEFLTNITSVLDSMNCKWVLLKQVVCDKLAYNNGVVAGEALNEDGYLDVASVKAVKECHDIDSNVEDIMVGIDAVIFTGGEDIEPTFYGYTAGWHGIQDEWDYNATRDVNDYLLMSYCLDKDIPVLGLCRGMQILGVVSGASTIQDIPTFFDALKVDYSYQHRNQKATPDSYRDYAAHDVTIEDTKSIMYDIYKTDRLTGCPSWHHQAILSVLGTPLKVSGYTMTSGITIIEAIERTDKTFAVGLQFHPEAAAVKHLNDSDNKNEFMPYDTAVLVFNKLIEATK